MLHVFITYSPDKYVINIIFAGPLEMLPSPQALLPPTTFLFFLGHLLSTSHKHQVCQAANVIQVLMGENTVWGKCKQQPLHASELGFLKLLNGWH